MSSSTAGAGAPGARNARAAPNAPKYASRDRLFAAAAREFAARGFAGTTVDRIAASARLNKAMIYYHFRSKRALYTEILRDMFGAVGSRVRGLATEAGSPEDRVRRFVEAIAIEADARPHFPPIWLRELAEGGAHLDETVVRDATAIVGVLAGILADGVRARTFRPVNPLLVHGGIVGPVLLFFASASLRKRLERAGLKDVETFGRDEVVQYVQRVTLGVLTGRV